MRRSTQPEILDNDGTPEELVARAYRQLAGIHRLLGDTAAVVAAIRRDPLPVRRVLDIGCGHGGVMRDVRRKCGVDVVGVDLRPPLAVDPDLTILHADATRDALPPADLAFSMHLGHHLSERDLIALIRNVGRSCRRLVLLDLVRHPAPLILFRAFIAPWVSRIVAVDGETSIRRSYTAAELRRLAAEALSGSAARFRHSVNPLYIRQTVEIWYQL